MNSSEKKIKNLIKEWGNIRRINELKAKEILVLNNIIVQGNKSINMAEEEIKRIESEISEKLKRYREIGEILDMLSNDEQEVIHLRYFKGCEWAAVARKMYISERQVFNIHKNALCKLNEFLEKRSAPANF